MSVEWANTGWGYEEIEWNMSFFLVELNHLKKMKSIASETPLKPKLRGHYLYSRHVAVVTKGSLIRVLSGNHM